MYAAYFTYDNGNTLLRRYNNETIEEIKKLLKGKDYTLYYCETVEDYFNLGKELLGKELQRSWRG